MGKHIMKISKLQELNDILINNAQVKQEIRLKTNIFLTCQTTESCCVLSKPVSFQKKEKDEAWEQEELEQLQPMKQLFSPKQK